MAMLSLTIGCLLAETFKDIAFLEERDMTAVRTNHHNNVYHIHSLFADGGYRADKWRNALFASKSAVGAIPDNEVLAEVFKFGVCKFRHNSNFCG